MPPAPRQSPPEPTALEGRVTQIEDRLDQIAATIERIAAIELPSPAALDELSVRMQALEERPEPVQYDTDRPPPERRAPAQKLCAECGAVDGTHFDDCQTGRGAAAMPKTAAEREQLKAERGLISHV